MNTKDQPRDWAGRMAEELIPNELIWRMNSSGAYLIDLRKRVYQAIRKVEEKRMRLDAEIAHKGDVDSAECSWVRDKILSARLGEGE